MKKPTLRFRRTAYGTEHRSLLRRLGYVRGVRQAPEQDGSPNTDRTKLEQRRVTERRRCLVLGALLALAPLGGCGGSLIGPWPTKVLARHLSLDPDGAMPLAHSPYVLGFRPRPCIDPCPAVLERLDVDTDRVRSGTEFSPDSDLVAFRHELAVVSAREVSADGNVSGGWRVTTVSPLSLRSSISKSLPVKSRLVGWEATAGSSGTDIWVSSGRQIVLVDPRTARILIRVPVPFDVTQLATAPDGSRVYVAGIPARKEEPVFLNEYDASNGHRLATLSERLPEGNLAILAPTDDGVWLVPGNAPPQLLRRQGLLRVHLRPGTLPPPGFGPYQDSVTDLGAFVLIKSESGESCVSPTNGRLRAKATWSLGGMAPSWSPLEINRGRVLVLSVHYPHVVGRPVPSNVGILSSVRVPAACFGS